MILAAGLIALIAVLNVWRLVHRVVNQVPKCNEDWIFF